MTEHQGSFIYKIETIEGVYIGKLANDQVWQSHLRRSGLPWYGTLSKDSIKWEKDWTSFIKKNGFQLEGTPKGFVQNIQIYAESSVTNAIKESFATQFQSSTMFDKIKTKERVDFYSALAEVWQLKGRGSSNLEITEALMIMLAVASGRKVLNTQVDFLTKAAKGRLNQESLAAMISVEELQRKYTHAILEPPHYYITVSTNGKIPQLIQDYAQLLTDTQLKKMGSNKRVTVKISSKNMDLLRYKADQSFFKHLYKNVLGRYNAIKGLKVGDQARQPMKEFLEDLKQLAQNPNATTKFQAVDAKGWFEQAQKIWNGITQGYESNIVPRRNSIFNIVVSMLQEWFQINQKNGIDAFMAGGIELKRPDNNYKIRMTEWISNNIFGNAYDAAYSEAQHRKFEQEELAYREAKQIKSQGKPLFFMGLPPTGDPYQGHWLVDVTRDKLIAELGSNNYLATHWSNVRSAYNEQVTYWLAQHNDTYYHTNYIMKYKHEKWVPNGDKLAQKDENAPKAITFY